MNTIDYYMELRFAFHTTSDHTPISVQTNQIADILHCSLRNTRILLKKMNAEGFIDWKSGKGRGNRSYLAFQLPLSSVVILHFQGLIQQNKINEAVQFLDRKEIPMEIKKKCYHHLRPSFGLHSPHITTEKQEPHSPPIAKKMTLNHIVRHVSNRTSSWMIGKKMTKKTMFQWPSSSKDDY
jgi:MarR-like DNA-binding transcriptional regulator SgrR of sgrS sRNA